MKIYCNPLNFGYKYQFNKQDDGSVVASREAADPSLIRFRGKYLLFPSMTAGFLYSEDLVHWEFQPTEHLPIYDYAPDVRTAGEYLYFCASSHEEGVFYRTRDPFGDEYERIEGAFPFWDPDLFVDEDGKFYFYWGSSTTEPLYGIELDPATMRPIGEKVALCAIDTEVKGYERNGENHVPSRSKEEMEMILAGLDRQNMPESMKEAARNYIMERPYMEGVWVNKHDGTYYLQYGTPSSGHNIYGDGVYVSDRPLGPYVLAKNNPYSYKPGGFLPGAGHGSTMEDEDGSVWHISTMRICKNHNFERRIGLWPAGYDGDGELFCNQRYGDWPMDLEKLRRDPWANPDWMLLSYGAKITASSVAEKKVITDAAAAAMGRTKTEEVSYDPQNVCDENIQTWWKADVAKTKETPQWISLDLGKICNVHAVQINFADDDLRPELPEGFGLRDALMQERWIDRTPQKTRWLLEGSVDGKDYFVIEDKRQAETDLPHDMVVSEDGWKLRYVRLTVTELPYGQAPCVSGLRVFGLGGGKLPAKPAQVTADLRTSLDLDVNWKDGAAVSDSAGGNSRDDSRDAGTDAETDAGTDAGTEGKSWDPAVGYVVNWGYAPDKLYHSYQVFDKRVSIGGLVKDQALYLRVDSFNENGITEGDVRKIL